MIRGIYSSASGMLSESLRNDAIANNLANVNTTGYKKDVAISQDFASMLINRINDTPGAKGIGSLGLGSVINEIATDRSAGSIRATGNSLDLAIDGKGYFALQTPDGIRYTRNGQFTRSAQGELVNSEGYQVLGQNGPVRIDGPQVVIADDGRVTMNGIEANRIAIFDLPEKQLTKQGSTLFMAAGNSRPTAANGQIRQGYLEMSNVNVVAEMVKMIAGYRAYEINSKAVQSHDQMLEKAVNEVGRAL